jgi:hypothetical protein
VLVSVAFALAARETGAPPILLFNGAGTSPNDVAALEQILKRNHFEYATADSRQLNAMSEARLSSHLPSSKAQQATAG